MLKRVSVELWFVRSTKSIRNYELGITLNCVSVEMGGGLLGFAQTHILFLS